MCARLCVCVAWIFDVARIEQILFNICYVQIAHDFFSVKQKPRGTLRNLPSDLLQEFLDDMYIVPTYD